MAKIVSILMAFLLLISSFGVHAVYSAENADLPEELVAAADTPVIALTHVPKYGEVSPFEGSVFMENGSGFSPADYHVTLYLKELDRSAYWVKPSAAQPFATIDSEGCFSIPYTSGGDTDKTDFWILLFPANVTKMQTTYYSDSSFDALCQSAVDFVKVTRTVDGDYTVTPHRTAPSPSNEAPAISALLPVSDEKIGVDVGFYTDGSAPGSALSEAKIRKHLEVVAPFADTVRFYNASGEINKAYRIAHDMGFSVVGTAYLGGTQAENKTELDALIALCNSGLVQVACVGNETLLVTDTSGPILTPEKLIEYINYVRDGISDESIPITTSDSVDVLMANPSVRRACNLLMPNCYPFWGGENNTDAAQSFIQSITALKGISGGKQVLVSETGWPTAGGKYGNAVTGEDEAAAYYEVVREWSLETGTQILYFSSADEPWKTESGFGPHWGFLTTELVLKDGYAGTSTTPFNNITPTPTPTPKPTVTPMPTPTATPTPKLTAMPTPTPKPKAPVIALTSAPALGDDSPFKGYIFMEDGSALSPKKYHITLYLQGADGRWWVKPSASKTYVTADSKGFFSIDYSIAGDTDKTDFRIVLLPANHEELSVSLYTYAMDALCREAVDYVTVKRTKSSVGINPKRYRFSDVLDSSHPYYRAIYWAAAEEITKGYSDGTFGINRPCTRGEMMMFLWRYAGKPNPKTASKSPFKDVPKNHVFYKAILWGSQKGITKGYSDGTFGINRNVSRGECMMFLWRLKGKPNPTAVSMSPFKDVPKTHVFYKAILWGAQKKVTTGYTSGEKKGTFGIDENCTRGQIVTFFYRAK